MTTENGYEIDFIAVGEGARSGDAIAVRWVVPDGFRVLVYDGGTKASGQQLVNHIRLHYNTNHVDYVVNSHPDGDHASGLSLILEQMTVGEVWMHRPWAHSEIIRQYFHDGRITDQSLQERLKEKMTAAHKIEKLANENGVPIHEPFQGMQIGPFRVMSPDKNWYLHELVADFAKSPEKKEHSLESMFLEAVAGVENAFRNVARLIAEAWDVEYLKEEVCTSAENESSVILFADFGGNGVMLTGDAGIQALDRAETYASNMGIHLPTRLRFIQVPHHGSRNNISTSIMDRLIGERRAADEVVYTKTAFVSAGAKSETHPRRMVVNAFTKRGTRVYWTKGQAIHHSTGMPERGSWVAIEPIPVSAEVEAWD
ncbi:ComEC/Rec2 family competence protein [Pseudomonas azotoformans]